MLRSLSLLSLFVCPQSCFTATAHTSVQMPTNVPSGYQLVWWDEFETDGFPDPKRWDYDTYWNAIGWFNEEQQYYSARRAENARIEDGHLIIEARREPVPARMFPDTGGQRYTSARLYTRERAAWLRGYIEIRAKLPCGVGLWPAIWTMPEHTDDWPNGGEIDIMEFYGHKPRQFEATVHTVNQNHVLGNNIGAAYRTDSACDRFYTHSLHWTEDIIRVSIDGEVYFSVERESNDPNDWPFTQPHYLILNMAVRNWAGGENGIDPNAFPARMEVDYVRVYQNPDAS